MIYVCEDSRDLNRVMHEIRANDTLYIPVYIANYAGHEKRIAEKRYNVTSSISGGVGEPVERNGKSWLKYKF